MFIIKFFANDDGSKSYQENDSFYERLHTKTVMTHCLNGKRKRAMRFHTREGAESVARLMLDPGFWPIEFEVIEVNRSTTRPKWVEYKPWNIDLHPPEKRYVLLRIDRGLKGPTLSVGWFKYAAGEVDSPYWVIPGGTHRTYNKPHAFPVDYTLAIPGEIDTITHYCDCLGDDFVYPNDIADNGEAVGGSNQQ